MIDALLFDLDDTLYPERDFVVSGYGAVARHVAVLCGKPASEIIDAMMTAYTVQGRKEVLPMVIERFLDSSVLLSDLVWVYRRHNPFISLMPGYAELLERLRKRYHLGILTDGLPEVQRRKIKALGLEDFVDGIVCTWDHGRENEKPSPLGFTILLDKLRAKASRSLHIGDNPDKDGAGARAAGLKFAHVLPSGPIDSAKRVDDAGEPEFVIRTLGELPAILRKMNGHA